MMNGPSAQARRAQAKREAHRDGRIGGAAVYKNGCTVVVKLEGGGAFPIDWERKTKLQESFGDFGQILRIDVPKGQGVAHIEYDDKRDAEEAAEVMNGKKISGQPVNVSIFSAAFDIRSGAAAGSVRTSILDMSRKYCLDEASTTRLVSVFTERVRMGCDLNKDIEDFSLHLAASSKPSAYVCMKLAELRAGQPIGPCKYGNRRLTNDKGESYRDLAVRTPVSEARRSDRDGVDQDSTVRGSGVSREDKREDRDGKDRDRDRRDWRDRDVKEITRDRGEDRSDGRESLRTRSRSRRAR